MRCHLAGLDVAAFVDDAQGPFFETGEGQALLVHGASPAPLVELQRRQPRFAAIQWDGRLLRASRDPMGLAPLFYRVFQGGVWLATEAQPLVALGRPGPDLEALARQAAFAPLVERTGWKGVHRVLPGSTIEVTPELEVASAAYWRPADLLGRYKGSPAEALAEFRDRFRTAVARCYEPGSGILLSGGLDSSAVALVAAQDARARPHFVYVHFPGFPEADEHEYAGVVAAAVGTPLHVVAGNVSGWDVGAELDGWGGIAYTWLPFDPPGPALAHLASQGVTVALDGHDGDGALGPPGSNLGDLVLKGELRRVGALAARHGGWSLIRGLAVDFVPPYAWLRRLAGRPKGVTYMQAVARYFSDALRPRLAEADIARWAWPSRRWRARQLQPLLPRATVSFELKEFEGARHGIDMRHPFADRDLVEFLVSLPGVIKTDPMRPKAVLVDSLSDVLPDVIQRRRKGDLSMAVVRRRVDAAACIETIRASGVRLPGVEYGPLFEDARADPDRVPLYFLLALARVHAFARSAGVSPD